MKSLVFFFTFAYLLGVSISESIGEFDLIDFDSLQSNKYLQNGHVVLVAINEQKKLDEPVQTELKKFKSWLDTSMNSVKLFVISDEKYIKSISFFKSPQVLFYRNGRYIQYKGEITSKNLSEWVENSRERVSKDLTDANFEHDTQASTGSTTGYWFILFSKKDCKTSHFIESSLEQASIKLENRVLFAYVNIDDNPKLQERFNLVNSPTLIFFKGGYMYRYELSTFDVDSLVSFVTVAYKNIKSEKVPGELTLFDKLTDEAVKFLKKQNLDKHINAIKIGAVAALVFLIVLVVYFKCIRSSKPKPSKGMKYSYESKEYYKLE